jgi:hypothetical protein
VVLHTPAHQQVVAAHLEEIQHLAGQAQAVAQMVLALVLPLIRGVVAVVQVRPAHQLVQLLHLRLVILKNLFLPHLPLMRTLLVLAVQREPQEQTDLLAGLVAPV